MWVSGTPWTVIMEYSMNSRLIRVIVKTKKENYRGKTVQVGSWSLYVGTQEHPPTKKHINTHTHTDLQIENPFIFLPDSHH